ncbi:MAG: PcfJ domain-containing protein [Bacteroidales bacterium]|nr:PcfJ domain-containing protein [Bacteroidales bacterium]
MKPRNKFEQAVLAESKHLRPITKTQSNWAFRECIDHFAYRLPKGRTTCMDCGHSWTLEQPIDTCTCPQCRASLQVKTTRARKLQQKQYFTLLTTCGEYQVLRMFLLVVGMEKGCRANTSVIEIGHYWWNARGRQTIVAIQRTLGRYVDSFSYCSPMAIRNDNEAYRYISYAPMYPKIKSMDILRRNGFKGDFHDIVPTTLIPALLTDSRAETLMKAERYEDLRYFLSKGKGFDNYWDAYKLGLRHRYAISDIALWCDYIDMLRRLGKDIHSPKYVCPTDLHKEHDLRQRELRRQQEKEETKRKQQKAMEDEERFQELKSKFFGISFTDGMIQVRTLESVQNYLTEGAELHHCVFSNEYYLKEDSLILSATIDGRRIETIEISLDTFQVVQSRGVCNQNSTYHDQIVSLVNANHQLIRQRMKATA